MLAWAARALWYHPSMNKAPCTLLLLLCTYLHGYDAATEAGQSDKVYRQAMNGREVVVLERLLNDDFLFIRRTGGIWDKEVFLEHIRRGS
jgi:hypothetical protein